MLDAFFKGISQLNDKQTRGALWLSIGAAIGVFAVLWTGIGFLLTETAFFAIGWLETAVDILGGLATLVLTWFLFPGVVSAVVGLFLEQIADAVEARHYPDLAPVDGLSLGASILTVIRFLAAVVVLNLVVFMFLIVPPLFPFVFYTANGYLVSREYFELVALRRMSRHDARTLRQAHRGQLLVIGVVTVILLTVPVVNLLTPVVSTAAMVHLIEGWRRAG